MAGDWIKMRAGLFDHPKVVAVSRILQQNATFREWFAPGSDMNGKTVSDFASRAVTVALLMRVWSVAREHGKFDGDDLYLEHSWIEDIDQFATAPGLGLAMQAVGWVITHPTKTGIILPNFKEFNVPMSEAERAKGYRDRKKSTVTIPSRTQRDEKAKIVTTREEKSKHTTPIVPQRFAEFWATYPSNRRVGRGGCESKWVKGKLHTVADEILDHVRAMKQSPDWIRDGGKYVPSTQTYLNQQRWRDGIPETQGKRLLAV